MTAPSRSSLWPPLLELPPRGPLTEKKKEEHRATSSVELPLDVLLILFHMLDQVDIIMGAGQVCRSWRRAARDMPELWRRIDMRFRTDLSLRVDRYKMSRSALWFSSGQCEAFRSERGVDMDALALLEDSKIYLKSLRIITCDYRISDHELQFPIAQFTQLEELELSNFWCDLSRTCEAVSKSCPLLKHFRLNKEGFRRIRYGVDDEAMAIAKMRGLCTLQLFAGHLSNNGLEAILDGCTRLESLDIRHCFNVEIDDEMLAKCSRINNLRLPDYSTDDYDLKFSSPDMRPLSPEVYMGSMWPIESY